MTRRLMKIPCHACGSRWTWGCAWCSPRRKLPVTRGFLPQREDDEAASRFFSIGMEKARISTACHNPNVEETYEP